MRSFILCTLTNGFKIKLDFVKYKGRFLQLHILEVSSKIEENFLIDLMELNIDFYYKNIYANVDVEYFKIRFVIDETDIIAYIDFDFNPRKTFGFLNKFQHFQEVKLIKSI